MKLTFDAIVAIFLAGAFAAALGVRAWCNTNRILTQRVEDRLRAAGTNAIRDMDPVDKAALRARLVTTAAATPLLDHFAAVDAPVPYALTDKAYTAPAVRVRRAGPFCSHYFTRGGTR